MQAVIALRAPRCRPCRRRYRGLSGEAYCLAQGGNSECRLAAEREHDRSKLRSGARRNAALRQSMPSPCAKLITATRGLFAGSPRLSPLTPPITRKKSKFFVFLKIWVSFALAIQGK